VDSLVAKARRSKAGIILMGYEGLRRHSESLLPLDWGYVVLDEGHRIRNPDAEITLLCKQVLPTKLHACHCSGRPFIHVKLLCQEL
jgi:SNF2 family DNA or RNA helicase